MTSVITTHLSLRAGMNLWKAIRRSAAKYKTKKLHFRDTFKPSHYIELSENQKKSILESHMFIKDMGDGTIKVITMTGE